MKGQDIVFDTKQTVRQKLQSRILTSNMLSATNEEVCSIINEQLEKNIALESDGSIGSLEDQSTNEQDAEPTDESVLDMPEGGSDSQNEYETPSDGEKIDSVMPSDDGDTSDSDVVGVKVTNEDEYCRLSNEVTFSESLKRQVADLDLDAEEDFLANYLIDSLDENGYLTTPLAQIADDLEFSEGHPTTVEDLEAVVVEVLQQELEPAGVFARNLQECVKLQIERMKGRYASYAYIIADKYFDLLADHRTDLIEKVLGLTNHQDLVNVMRIFKHVNPRPGGSVQGESKSEQTVIPDFVVRDVDGHFLVSIYDRVTPSVYVSQTAKEELSKLEAIKHRTEDVKKGIDMYRSSISSAESFVGALARRRETMLLVMRAIVAMQNPFFKTGEKELLRPMRLKTIAEKTELDISTISRVCSNRWVDTDYGYFKLNDLFTKEVSGGTDDSEGVSVEVLKQAITDIIEKEDKKKPLSDEAILAELKKRGLDGVSRRTVSKYRTTMGIPTQRERKTFI